jgi:hypothetical protein
VIAIPRRLLLQGVACTHAIDRPQHGHRRTTSRTLRSELSPDSRTVHRQATYLDIIDRDPRYLLNFLRSTRRTSGAILDPLVNLEESKSKYRSTKTKTNLAFFTHEDAAMVTPIATRLDLRAGPIVSSVLRGDTVRWKCLQFLLLGSRAVNTRLGRMLVEVAVWLCRPVRNLTSRCKMDEIDDFEPSLLMLNLVSATTGTVWLAKSGRLQYLRKT